MKFIYTYIFLIFFTSIITADMIGENRVIISGDLMKRKNWNNQEMPSFLDSILFRGGNKFVLKGNLAEKIGGQIFTVSVGYKAADDSQTTVVDYKEEAYILSSSNFTIGVNSPLDRVEPTTPIKFNMSGGRIVCAQFIIGGAPTDEKFGLSNVEFNMTGGTVRAKRLYTGYGTAPSIINFTGGKILLGSIEDLVNYDYDEYYKPGDNSFSINVGELSQPTINWSILSRDYTQIIIEQGTRANNNFRNTIVNFNLSLLRRPIELPLIDNRGTGMISDANVTFNFHQLASDLKAEVTKGDGNDWILSITKK